MKTHESCSKLTIKTTETNFHSLVRFPWIRSFNRFVVNIWELWEGFWICKQSLVYMHMIRHLWEL